MIDINLACHRILNYDGFGRYITQMSEAMLLSGKFDVHPYLMEQLEWPGFLQNAAGMDHSRLTLFLCPPNWIKKPAPSRAWLLAMHESSQLPSGWAEATNSAERLITPCEWTAEVYRSSGVTIPISVVNPGVNFKECAVLPAHRKNARPYTFLTLGDRGFRKGWWITYAAFFEAFRDDDNVSLIIKTNLNRDIRKFFPNNRSLEGLQGHIRVWAERVDTIRDIFAQADCLVYPAHGEGWGLFPREAAACGLPVIATNYSGLAVNCDKWAYPLNDWQLAPAPGEQEGLPGMWAHPNVHEVADWMRFCYENQDDAREKGQQSAAWLRQHATWEQSADALYEVFTAGDRLRTQREQEYGRQEAQRPTTLQELKTAILAPEKVNGHHVLL